MKRAIYEWFGLAFVALAIACILGWSVSRKFSKTAVELSFGYRVQMVVEVDGGSITFRDRSANQEVIELVKNSGSQLLTADYGWSLPGLKFDYLSFENRPPIWSLHFSLLIPFVVFFVTGGFCLNRYRIIRRRKDARI